MVRDGLWIIGVGVVLPPVYVFVMKRATKGGGDSINSLYKPSHYCFSDVSRSADLKPRVASTLLPGLPAHIVFMCIRHADYINNDEKIKSFLTATITAVRRLIKKRHEDLDISALWLVNTCRLMHNLKQYSGEKVRHLPTSWVCAIY